ncbi:hypothetical protein, partial [Flavihumibacter sp. CACIAM 22H1]|uniref:hypothetical protein n=1 Tax=Flavihumibacter sp. CACIAM 22H1 TaxID=1812911 RepID=UPI0025C4250D
MQQLLLPATLLIGSMSMAQVKQLTLSGELTVKNVITATHKPIDTSLSKLSYRWFLSDTTGKNW